MTRRLLLALACVVLAGCGAPRPEPTPLEPLEPKIAGRPVWQASLGGPIGFPQAVAARDGQFFVAADDGTVVAIDASTGQVRWRANAGARLAAGVGSDGRHTAVVTRGQELVVFDQGRPSWRARLPGGVVTAPLVAGQRVFVLALDRSVRAYDVRDGLPLWQLARPFDPLTLGQAGVLAPFGDLLLVGQGARLAAVDPLRGQVRWEVPVAQPRGTNEVERLADLVGPASRVGSTVCVRAFQAGVGCVDAARGQIRWRRAAGGTQAIAADASVVVAADGSDRLVAWRQDDGALLWSSERLRHRDLAGLTMAGSAVVGVDALGIVHFLDRLDGRPLLRLSTDASAAVGAPVVEGAVLLVVKRSGALFAFRPE